MNVPGAFEDNESSTSLSLPLYRTELPEVVDRDRNLRSQDDGVVQVEESSTSTRANSLLGSSWLGKCYGSVQKLVGSRLRPGVRDEESALPGATVAVFEDLLEPANLKRRPSHRRQSKDASSDADEVQSYHTAAATDEQSSIQTSLAALAITSESRPRLLSDEENNRMNRKIDRLIAAIDDRRPIHFAPDAETGEVEIFADSQGEVIDPDRHELEQIMAASSETSRRVIRARNDIHHIRSTHSLRSAGKSESWASTDSMKSSSDAWERAVAAADIRFALENRGMDRGITVIRRPSRNLEIEPEARPSRQKSHVVSPIPLDFNKQIRASTPSIHSTGSEMDTSSPLFRKSCGRVLREAYAESPELTFQRKLQEYSRLDEWAFVSEPPDESSPEQRQSKAPSSTGRAFGVFEDTSKDKFPSKEAEKPAVRSKALKDVSNLRRPGYLQFNSFSKNTNPAADRTGTAVPVTASSIGFGGAYDPETRRMYIRSKWPGLLEDRNNVSMAEPPRIDGVARRRNEQAIGRPIDRSHYSLSHVRTSVVDSSLNQDPVRQAHFDLALARLEGRALPPPPSPIHRHPDSAALFDRDVQIEGSHRPLPLRGPRPRRPANPTPHRAFWRNLL